jgi:hypothetical protein
VGFLLAALAGAAALAGCGPTRCDEPTHDRVLLGVMSLGLNEIAHAKDCPSGGIIENKKKESRKGNPSEQYWLYRYYQSKADQGLLDSGPYKKDSSLFTFLAQVLNPNDTEQFRSAATQLLICSAEGGHTLAQEELVDLDLPCKDDRVHWPCSVEERDAQRLRYKFATILHASDSANAKWPERIEESRTNLSETDLQQLDKEISSFTPAPRRCDFSVPW